MPNTRPRSNHTAISESSVGLLLAMSMLALEFSKREQLRWLISSSEPEAGRGNMKDAFREQAICTLPSHRSHRTSNPRLFHLHCSIYRKMPFISICEVRTLRNYQLAISQLIVWPAMNGTTDSSPFLKALAIITGADTFRKRTFIPEPAATSHP